MSQKLPAPAPHESRPAPPPTPPANGDHLLTICKQCKCVRKYCTCAYGQPAAVTPERPTYEELLAGLKELTAYHNDFLDYVMNGKPIKNRNAPKRIGALIARAGG